MLKVKSNFNSNPFYYLRTTEILSTSEPLKWAIHFILDTKRCNYYIFNQKLGDLEKITDKGNITTNVILAICTVTHTWERHINTIIRLFTITKPIGSKTVRIKFYSVKCKYKHCIPTIQLLATSNWYLSYFTHYSSKSGIEWINLSSIY